MCQEESCVKTVQIGSGAVLRSLHCLYYQIRRCWLYGKLTSLVQQCGTSPRLVAFFWLHSRASDQALSVINTCKTGNKNTTKQQTPQTQSLPDSWPLARLSITLDGLTSQLSKVVMTATMEIIASCRYPDYGLPSVTQLAKDVTIALALHLADLVANWLCGKLDQQAVLLFNESTACMLQASYWVRPIYEELLYSSSHAYQGSQ